MKHGGALRQVVDRINNALGFSRKATHLFIDFEHGKPQVKLDPNGNGTPTLEVSDRLPKAQLATWLAGFESGVEITKTCKTGLGPDWVEITDVNEQSESLRVFAHRSIQSDNG